MPSESNALKNRAAPRFEMRDGSVHRVSAQRLIPQSVQPRNAGELAARLAHQFIALNRPVFDLAAVEARVEYDGDGVRLAFASSSVACSLPLRSPTSGRVEWALTVHPRFPWQGLGPMLGNMGWRIVPTIAPYPALPHSDRQVPPWVLSSIVLVRLRQLLESVQRRFELRHSMRNAPRGRVDWSQYASRSVGRGRFVDVPCTLPELTADRDLRSAIHYTAAVHAASLESQSAAGAHVRMLLAMAEDIRNAVSDVPPIRPAALQLQRFGRGAMGGQHYHAGLEAIGWTVDERGLAGASDVTGLPWTLPMDEFFEAWSETVAAMLATLTGARLRVGRKRETVAPIHWDPPFTGSQRYLLPDLILERSDVTVIVDAKYKPHLEELHETAWAGSSDALRERHREDLLQALAYASLSNTNRTVVCLAYPVSTSTWKSMRERARLIHRGSLHAGDRQLEVALVAVPMHAEVRAVAETMLGLIE